MVGITVRAARKIEAKLMYAQIVTGSQTGDEGKKKKEEPNNSDLSHKVFHLSRFDRMQKEYSCVAPV